MGKAKVAGKSTRDARGRTSRGILPFIEVMTGDDPDLFGIAMTAAFATFQFRRTVVHGAEPRGGGTAEPAGGPGCHGTGHPPGRIRDSGGGEYLPGSFPQATTQSGTFAR